MSQSIPREPESKPEPTSGQPSQAALREKQEEAETTQRTGSPGQPSGVEGEGSYSAARQYKAGVKKHTEEQDPEALGRAAREALEGEEAEELAEAERKGRAPAQS